MTRINVSDMKVCVSCQYRGLGITHRWFISVCKRQTFNKYDENFKDKLVHQGTFLPAGTNRQQHFANRKSCFIINVVISCNNQYVYFWASKCINLNIMTINVSIGRFTNLNIMNKIWFCKCLGILGSTEMKSVKTVSKVLYLNSL